MSAQRDPEVELAEMFGEVARALQAQDDVDETLHKICQLAVDTIDGCQSAGISLVKRREITSVTFTNDVPRMVDAIQAAADQGPCLDAIKEHKTFLTGCLASDDRWPEFSKRAFDETGTQSVLGLRLFCDGDTLGALNLYSAQTDAFDDHDIAVGSVFATHAAVAFATATREEQLQDKAATRDIIGQAKGVLMDSRHLTADQAFEVLKVASQRLNEKLSVIAEAVSETGEVPTSSDI